MHEPANGVRVTNADIYNKLSDVDRRLARIEVTVDKVVEPSIESQGARIDRLEMRVYAILAGLVAAAVAAIGAKGAGLI